MKKSVKLLALVLAIALVAVSFMGCNKQGGSAEQVVRYNLGAEPKTLDPALNNAVDGGIVILANFEGLTKLDNKDVPQKGMADSWEIKDNGTTYVFKLKDGVKWSDGQPVKAKDFEFAWKRALDPNTAAEYAYQLYYIKNGEAFNTKKAGVGKDDVGVKALDDKTLEVKLEYPVPYFLSLTAFPTYMPVREDKVGDATWATKPDTYIGNGPFKLKEWRPKDKIILVKNENYYDAKSVKLASVEMSMIEESTSALASFKAGTLDFIDSVPAQEVPNLLKDGTAKTVPYLGTYFYVINLSPKAKDVDAAAAKVLADKRVRQALAYAIDRKAICETVLQAGQVPATTYVPKSILVGSKNEDFKNKDYYSPTGDVAKAKELLAAAGYPDGKNFPKVTLLYNNGSGHQNVAQAVQEMWKKNLGIEITLANQEWKVFQTTRSDKNYLIARHGWIGDYVDPMTFLDMWTTTSGQNDAAFDNAAYNKAIDDAKREADVDKRITLLHGAEDILMEEMPVIPIYYYVSVVCQKPYVKDIFKSQLGFVYFDRAYIQK